jgi:hypothetical protein
VPEALLAPSTTVLVAGTETYTLPAVAEAMSPSATKVSDGSPVFSGPVALTSLEYTWASV